MNAGKKVVKSVPEAKQKSKSALPAAKSVKAEPKAAPKKVVAAPAPKTAASVAKPAQPKAKTVVKASKPSKPSAPAVVAKPAAPASKKPVAAAKPSVEKNTHTAPHSFSPEYLVVMQKDPNWMHAFWDVSERRVQSAVQGGAKLVLRLYDVSSDITVKANKARNFRDIEVPSDARSWYIQSPGESSSMHVALGTVSSSGGFEPIVNSDQVQSFGSEGQFLGGAADDIFLRASLGGNAINGFGSSAQMLPGVSSASFLFAPSSETFSSLAFSSQAFSSASLLQASGGSDSVQRGKDFFLWVKTRLIVYGGTRPDAHLQVRGQPFPLNPDGTFSLEMDLPDSTQIIPVFATDREGDFPTTIVPVVVKRTE